MSDKSDYWLISYSWKQRTKKKRIILKVPSILDKSISFSSSVMFIHFNDFRSKTSLDSTSDFSSFSFSGNTDASSRNLVSSGI